MIKFFNTCALILLFINAFGQGDKDSTSNVKEGPVGMTVKEFQERTCVANKLVLVNFTADWCVVCKKQKPIIAAIKTEKQKTVDVMILDMEDNPLIAEYFEVDGLPIIILYKDGVIMWDRMGLQTKQEIIDVIKAFE